MKSIIKYFILFSIGGIAYIIIEMLWRGFSHWSMFLLGGVCFVLLGLINEHTADEMPLIVQMLIGAFIITFLEFITGYIVNIRLGMYVWDYGDMPVNIMGQVCLPYTAMWFVLSGVCVIADDWVRYLFFGEEKPSYRIF